MRGLRLAGIAAVAFVAAAVLAVILGWLLFDPNEHKDRVQAAFRDATGRELRLDGPLSVSIFPWLAIDSGRATVANRAGFGDEPFASFERARLGVRLWPLLTARRLEIGPVRLEGLALRLAVARDGSNNWSDVLDRLEQRPPNEPSASADGGGERAHVARFELRDASVSFSDQQAGTRYEVTHWQLETGSLERGAAFDLETSLRVARDERDLGHVSLSTRIDPTQTERVALTQTVGTIRLPSQRSGDDVEVDLRASRLELENASRNISVQGLEAQLGEAVLSSTLRIVQGDAGPRADGDLRLARTDPRKLLAALGFAAPRTRDPDALRRLALNSKVVYTAERGLRLDALDLQLDDLQLKGRVDVRPGDRREVRFDLRGTTLDVDGYLPPADAPPTKPPASGSTGDRGSASRARVDLRGTVALDRLVVMKIPLQDVRTDLRLGGGRFELAPLRARAFGGSIVTRLRYDHAASVPALSLRQQLSGVDVAALLGQLFDAKQLEGRGNAQFSLDSHGADGAALFANLRGPFEVEVADGAVLGVDLWYELERAVATAQLKGAAAGTQDSGRTTFERLSARGTLTEKTLRSDQLEFVTDFARVRGHGEADYGRDALDLDLKARLLKAPEGRLLGVKVSRVKDADIPLRVTGTLADPKVRPDVSKLLEAMARDAIKRPLEGRIKEELEKIFKF